MDTETFDQVTLGADILGEEQTAFLQENMIVTIESYEDRPISVQLPTRWCCGWSRRTRS